MAVVVGLVATIGVTGVAHAMPSGQSRTHTSPVNHDNAPIGAVHRAVVRSLRTVADRGRLVINYLYRAGPRMYDWVAGRVADQIFGRQDRARLQTQWGHEPWPSLVGPPGEPSRFRLRVVTVGSMTAKMRNGETGYAFVKVGQKVGVHELSKKLNGEVSTRFLGWELGDRVDLSPRGEEKEEWPPAGASKVGMFVLEESGSQSERGSSSIRAFHEGREFQVPSRSVLEQVASSLESDQQLEGRLKKEASETDGVRTYLRIFAVKKNAAEKNLDRPLKYYVWGHWGSNSKDQRKKEFDDVAKMVSWLSDKKLPLEDLTFQRIT